MIVLIVGNVYQPELDHLRNICIPFAETKITPCPICLYFIISPLYQLLTRGSTQYIYKHCDTSRTVDADYGTQCL